MWVSRIWLAHRVALKGAFSHLLFFPAGEMTSSLTTNLWKPAQLKLCDNEYDKVTKHREA